ncbi:type II toxin-antitoxin system RelE/ParE family toxin [Acidisoma cellulosilytica]|uniref:Type II toxin-antitoxin system RelE/ParE family toxin n=1 Tax=Acidisoma cellulosilyticum TaxID=2802395 RepID=A0A963YXA1_9PROT|nr:type II toxin-antitoxin system RelE/ParE family toxin [Acidisoma cellulosilyticum]
MRVIWTDAALRGVSRAYDYLIEFNPYAAQHLAEGLLRTGETLSHFPHRGRPVTGTALREIVVTHPYILRYRVQSDEVVILRVRHASRKPTTP